MEYFIKVHPAALVLLPNDQAPVVLPTKGNIYNSISALTAAVGAEPTLFMVEKPYLNLNNNKQNPTQIIITQRAYGALLYSLQTTFPHIPIREFTSAHIRKQILPENLKPSKDHMLTLVNSNYDTLKLNYTPVEELCIYDAYLLQEYYRKQQ